MELHEFHVDKPRSRSVCKSDTIPGGNSRISRSLENLADATSGKHHRTGANSHERIIVQQMNTGTATLS
jgi:hypothetical protein